MKKYEKQFLRLLNHSIKGTTLDNIEETFQWDMIYKEAKAHNVEGLIYSAIGKDQLMKTIDRDLLNEWTKKTIFSSVRQKKHIDEMCRVFDAFNKANIPVIALKGLVLRDLYPKPDLRTMGDSDILIHPDDMEKANLILKNMNYLSLEEHNPNPKVDIKYTKHGCLPIELHWQLINLDYYNGNLLAFENTLWDNVLPYNIQDTSTLSLNLETLAVYKCIHMAKHLAWSGFGIRYLCDFALLLENHEHLIDWNLFIKKSKDYSILKFSIIAILTCNKLFNTKIPQEIDIIKPTKSINSHIETLISEIFESGIHGRKNIVKLMTTKMSFTNETSNSFNDNKSILYKFISFLFPSKSTLCYKYDYINRYPFMLPIAWIQNTFYRIFITKYSFTDKLKLLFYGLYYTKKRNKMIHWLEL